MTRAKRRAARSNPCPTCDARPGQYCRYLDESKHRARPTHDYIHRGRAEIAAFVTEHRIASGRAYIP